MTAVATGATPNAGELRTTGTAPGAAGAAGCCDGRNASSEMITFGSPPGAGEGCAADAWDNDARRGTGAGGAGTAAAGAGVGATGEDIAGAAAASAGG
ncbi:MAG: hypothetical protein HY907_02675, partial [Deltaproteobacteria bacterium]|nr:hypothetical protein [Deltaproteobacteria bacterium]